MFAVLERDATMFLPVSQNAVDMLKPTRGETILDVGCGLGIDALKFASLGAKTTGVDASQKIIQKAWSKVAISIGKNYAITFKRGMEENLIEMFGDGSFDGVYASRLLEHVENPRSTLRRFGRVVNRGGRVVVAEPDWATMAIDHPNEKMTERILQLFKNSVRHPSIGRKLRRTMRELGYQHMAMRAVPVVFVDPVSSGLIDGIETFVQQGKKF
jgi:ubiquinone/menaquinone biosynthesis C-methylase UbiE